MNAFDQMREAINNAKSVQDAARNNASQMADLLVGNLAHCRAGTLRKLKQELARYNMHTGTWRDAK